jgi:predicted transport protein
MTIEEAYKIEYGQELSATMRDMVAWNFNSTGSTYKGGNLFRDNNTIKANLVSNPIRRLNGGLYKLAILNDDINTMFLQSRVKNILLEIDCKTYGDLIKIGRKNIRDVKSIGSICIAELDAEMDRVGLTEYWMGIKTISNE